MSLLFSTKPTIHYLENGSVRGLHIYLKVNQGENQHLSIEIERMILFGYWIIFKYGTV